MTSTAPDLARAAQEQTLQATRQSQEAIVTAVRTWADAVARATPAGARTAFPTIATFPYAARLPTIEEILDSNFEFAGKLLDAQREFTKNLVAAVAAGARA